jgi:hypothetical protein
MSTSTTRQRSETTRGGLDQRRGALPARRLHHGAPRHRRDRWRAARLGRRTVIRRHPLRSLLVIALLALSPVWVSLGEALDNPGLGSSLPARFAEWSRTHGASGVVDWAENLWYSHHQPPIGGRPPKGAIPPPVALSPSVGERNGSQGAGRSATDRGAAASPAARTGRPLAAAGSSRSPAASATNRGRKAPAVGVPGPKAIVPLASPPLPGEGDWHPAGRLVEGRPALYEAFLRPDSIHTSLVVGVAWMDTKLLSAALYSGSTVPGGGPYPLTAPVSPTAATTLVAAFNAGFLMADAEGGYYTDGRTIIPLRAGAASFVVYKNGDAKIGAWGDEVRMTPGVVSVRQNLDLLVDNGKAVPGLNPNDTTQWGFTLGNAVYVWRSGLGVTANGALLYVGGPGLNITSLAALLVRAGAVRAMELDINTDWVSYSTYKPATPSGAADPGNGSELLTDMASTPARWFEPWWSRDFITVSARQHG